MLSTSWLVNSNTLNYLAATLTAKKVMMITKQKYFETKLHIHNTKEDVALTNVTLETNYFHDFVQLP